MLMAAHLITLRFGIFFFPKLERYVQNRTGHKLTEDLVYIWFGSPLSLQMNSEY